MTKTANNTFRVKKHRLKLKMTKHKEVFKIGLLDAILVIQKVANLNYWLHPEYDNPIDYMREQLEDKYPQFNWVYCSKTKQIRINI